MKQDKQKQATDPIDQKDEVKKSKDKRITQDFPGYPHPPSQEATIKKEKKTTHDHEQNSDGSPNAFGESENDVLRGEMDKDDKPNY